MNPNAYTVQWDEDDEEGATVLKEKPPRSEALTQTLALASKERQKRL